MRQFFRTISQIASGSNIFIEPLSKLLATRSIEVAKKLVYLIYYMSFNRVKKNSMGECNEFRGQCLLVHTGLSNGRIHSGSRRGKA